MSKKSKQIEESLKTGDKRYVKDDLHRVIENLKTGEQKFTGYYAGNDNEVYSTRAWSKKRIQKKKRAQKARLKTFEKEQEEARLLHKKKILFSIFGFVIILATVVGVFYAIRSSDENLQNNVSPLNNAKTTSVQEFTTSNVDSIFGNARITGNDVNIRAQPNLNAAIINFFPKEGERVLIIQPASDTLSWYKVSRKDGTTGWVFSEYVGPISIAED